MLLFWLLLTFESHEISPTKSVLSHLYGNMLKSVKCLPVEVIDAIFVKLESLDTSILFFSFLCFELQLQQITDPSLEAEIKYSPSREYFTPEKNKKIIIYSSPLKFVN